MQKPVVLHPLVGFADKRGSFRCISTTETQNSRQMETVRAHEELLADNELVIFDQCLGQAIFVSHEWCGRRHPDPWQTWLRLRLWLFRTGLATGELWACIDVRCFNGVLVCFT